MGIMFYKFVNKKSRTAQIFHPSFSVSFLLHIGQFVLYYIIIKSPLSSKKSMVTITIYCINHILFYWSMVHYKKMRLFFQMSINSFHVPTFVHSELFASLRGRQQSRLWFHVSILFDWSKFHYLLLLKGKWSMTEFYQQRDCLNFNKR